MPILMLLIGLGMLACWIFVEVKIFQSGNILMGILGICGIVSFIYGWIKSGELGIQKVMMIWTVLLVIDIILQAAFGTPHMTPPR